VTSAKSSSWISGVSAKISSSWFSSGGNYGQIFRVLLHIFQVQFGLFVLKLFTNFALIGIWVEIFIDLGIQIFFLLIEPRFQIFDLEIFLSLGFFQILEFLPPIVLSPLISHLGVPFPLLVLDVFLELAILDLVESGSTIWDGLERFLGIFEIFLVELGRSLEPIWGVDWLFRLDHLQNGSLSRRTSLGAASEEFFK